VAAARFASALRSERGDAAVVTIYGELAGGCYPHPGVPVFDAKDRRLPRRSKEGPRR